MLDKLSREIIDTIKKNESDSSIFIKKCTKCGDEFVALIYYTKDNQIICPDCVDKMYKETLRNDR